MSARGGIWMKNMKLKLARIEKDLSQQELANIIEQKLMFRLNRTGAVWT